MQANAKSFTFEAVTINPKSFVGVTVAVNASEVKVKEEEHAR